MISGDHDINLDSYHFSSCWKFLHQSPLDPHPMYHRLTLAIEYPSYMLLYPPLLVLRQLTVLLLNYP